MGAMRPRCGKQVGDDLYVHMTQLDQVGSDRDLASIRAAIDLVSAEHAATPNVIKLNRRSGGFSLLLYPGFEQDPFPSLRHSWTFAAGKNGPAFRTYESSLNPPILHRKELLVGEDHPQREQWQRTTVDAESLGLFDQPTLIGFRANWERLIRGRGYELRGNAFVPLANAEAEGAWSAEDSEAVVLRHLTALTRANLSAPVQLLIRHGMLTKDRTFFDYGCGRGDDLATLSEAGYRAVGWDPHYAPDRPREPADVVNLGFVINVIEDPAERLEALAGAFALARGVLGVGVMLNTSSNAAGRPYRDGYLTSRRTFQKYFAQDELREYLAHALQREVFLVGPGVALVFSDPVMEQRFSVDRFRRRGLAHRILQSSRAPKIQVPRPSRIEMRAVADEQRLASLRVQLAPLWEAMLELGRFPEQDESDALSVLVPEHGSPPRIERLVTQLFSYDELIKARNARTEDLRLFFACQQFSRRPPLRDLDLRLKRDIKVFFGDYRSAQEAGRKLLAEAASPENLFVAGVAAAADGRGWMSEDQRSLHVHIGQVPNLPAVLRAYVECGLLLWGAMDHADVIKIHIASGKLTLLAFDGFEDKPIPMLRRRVKIDLHRLDYDIFEYGTERFPAAPLYWKSRYLHEEHPRYSEQKAFDESLAEYGVVSPGEAPSVQELQRRLRRRRLTIADYCLTPCRDVPDLIEPCSEYLRFADLVACGETQRRTGIINLPKQAASYNALSDLATQVLDPVIEYFGAIRLTYGFCSADLQRHIRRGVAPKIDQHAGCELDRNGNLRCDRGGAACDFIVDDEDMEEVAAWIIEHLPFDRLYFYGRDRPLHVSYTNAPERLAYRLTESASGRRIPRAW